jgi:sRNA-binding protein
MTTAAPDLPTATAPAKAPRFDLTVIYPACFDWSHPRPIKLGIHRDLVTAGHRGRDVRIALYRYCANPNYLRAIVLDAPRIDLQGQPGGVVIEAEAVSAQAILDSGRRPPKRRPMAVVPDLPKDIALNEENIVPGRLELTLKFSEMPKAAPVKDGMKIGIQTPGALVVTTLSPKSWKRLVQATNSWPHWVASVNGKLGVKAGADGSAVVVLEQPALQVFEKKVKAAPG